MEKYDCTLDTIFNDEKLLPFSFKLIARATYYLIRAIMNMHTKKIMHRDLKPANVFVNLPVDKS
jgi:serine/threonine protein kinase